MNERVKELLVQSGLLDYTKIVVPEHEKFAELSECEKELPRNVSCKIIAVPVDKN